MKRARRMEYRFESLELRRLLAAVAATVTVPAQLNVYAEATFTFGANPSAGNFIYSVAWGDEYESGESTPTFSGPGSGTPMTHTYLDPGDYTMTVTAQADADGSLSPPLTRLITVGQRPDFVFFQNVLYVGGTPGNDTIAITSSGSNVHITRNGVGRDFAADFLPVIDISVLEGDDTVTVEPQITIEVDVDGGEGSDTITTGAGDDFIWTYNGHNVINAGQGNNHITTGTESETIVTGDGNDTIDGNSSSGGDTIFTAGGDDEIDFGHGVGSNAGDTLDSGAGNDYIYGRYADLIQAGPGNDSIVMEFAATIQGGPGNDRIRVTEPDSNEHPAIVFGNDGDDRINTGSAPDSLYGGAGRDRIYGGNGGDLISGGGGHDHLFGQAGNDRLYGGAGNDRLEGYTGNDRLTGGLGADLIHGGEGENTAQQDEDDSVLDIQHFT